MYKGNLPEAYQSVMLTLINSARDNMRNDGLLTPIAFVGRLSPDAIEPIALDFTTEEAKQQSVWLVKMNAHRVDADYVVLISEAWSAKVPDVKPNASAADVRAKKAMYERRYKSIESDPSHIEVVTVVLDTHDGLYTGIAPILGKQKKRTFGVVKFELQPFAMGRMSDFLPPRTTPQ